MILVFGKSGQLASAFRSLIKDREVLFLPSGEVDLAKPGLALEAIKKYKPEVVINCSAYTAVDKAESEQDLCYRINAEAVKEIAEASLSVGARILHFSTDYVYPGSGDFAHCENDPKSPLSFYGKSKLAGEVFLAESGAFFHNIRISWVYSAGGTNFVKTMLRLGADRTELKIVADQVGSPMSAMAIADLMMKSSVPCLLAKSCEDRATYNLKAGTYTTWYEFAQQIFREARELGLPLKVEKVLPILSAEYPTPAKRPLNSRMSDEKFKARFGLGLPDWQNSLKEAVVEIAKSSAQ